MNSYTKTKVCISTHTCKYISGIRTNIIVYDTNDIQIRIIV